MNNGLRVPIRLASVAGESRRTWEDGAACRHHDPTLFFGPNRFEPKRERMAREDAAKDVCRHCPVQVACREHALASGEVFGVWGGLGESERRGGGRRRAS